MKVKSLLFLLIAVAAAIAVYYLNSKQSSDVAGINSKLIPGLAANLNDVSSLTIYGAGDKVLTKLNKTDNKWVVAERSDYEADIGLIRNEFDSLKDAKIIEAKTSNPENYSKLGVEDLSDSDAQGVKFSIEGLTNSVSIIVGKNGTGNKNTQFVRRTDDSQTWLIDKKLNLKRDVTQWLRKDIIDIPPERIKKINIQHPSQESINIENTGKAENEFKLINTVAEGEKVSESEVYQVVNALSSLQITDVVLLEKVLVAEITPVVAKYYTYDGLTITVNTIEQDEETYSYFKIAFNAENVVKNSKVNEADSVLNSDPEEAEKIAKTLTDRISKWAYVLPDISQDALVKRLDNFILADQPAGIADK